MPVIAVVAIANADPVVSEGSEDKVSFRAGWKVKPEPFAAEYCQEFGREPVKLAFEIAGKLTRKWQYACVPGDPHHRFRAFTSEEKITIASHFQRHNREEVANYILCLAAHEGNDYAQAKLGFFYRQGTAGYPKDLERAFLWYSLSGLYEAGMLEQLSASMPPDDLERVRRLVANWEPDQTMCELQEAASPGQESEPNYRLDLDRQAMMLV